VAQRLEELRPDVLVLVAAKARGRPAGTVERREATGLPETAAEIQGSVADAVSGYIDVDLVLDVAHGLGVLPERTVTIEVEPARVEPDVTLSPEAQAGLAEALRLVRDEVARSLSA
jgi:hypothetical protein